MSEKQRVSQLVKRLFLLGLGLLLAFSIVSCNNDDDDSESSSKNDDATSETTSAADSIAENTIIFPARAEDNSHEFYMELLQRALTDAGYDLQIQLTDPLPQTRTVEMLDQGEISLLWMLQTDERDAMYIPIEVGLTNGLIGNRIFLIAPGTAETYATVATLDDFKALGVVGGFGANWFDAKVWEANGLDYVEVDGDWKTIYAMLERGDRGIDYFSRGFTEIRADAEAHPELEIEGHLLFVYDRDFIFYLSPAYAQYKDQIQDALEKARDSGLIDQLVREFWAEDFATLDYDNRTVINLTTPE